MLKLTHQLFTWKAEARLADFYERALYNHILSTQHPGDGRVIYNLSLEMGGRKHYETLFDSFTCCVGTGMENHAKYGSSIYFHSADALVVNLFAASEVTWAEKGIDAAAGHAFSRRGHDAPSLHVARARPPLTLRIRHPGWTPSLEVMVNGEPVQVASAPSSYADVTRTWADGDVVTVRTPMTLRLEPMPDNPARVAILFGPHRARGRPGAAGRSRRPRAGLRARAAHGRPRTVGLARQRCRRSRPPSGPSGVGRPRDVVLRPFFRVHDRRYTVYWDVVTPESLDRARARGCGRARAGGRISTGGPSTRCV